MTDTKRLNFLEKHNIEIVILNKEYNLVWDNLGKEVKGNTIREAIDQAILKQEESKNVSSSNSNNSH